MATLSRDDVLLEQLAEAFGPNSTMFNCVLFMDSKTGYRLTMRANVFTKDIKYILSNTTDSTNWTKTFDNLYDGAKAYVEVVGYLLREI